MKLGFILAAATVLFVLWLAQRNSPFLENWGGDLGTALQQASSENRRVLAFFMYSPPGRTERWLAANPISKNQRAIQQGRYLCAKVVVSTDLKDALSRTYRIQQVPTLLVLSPQGRELGRRTGRVGELELTRFLEDPNAPAP